MAWNQPGGNNNNPWGKKPPAGGGDLDQAFKDWQKRVGDTARNVGTATDDYVHQNTWSSIAFAAVIGCVIGFLLGNRRD